MTETEKLTGPALTEALTSRGLDTDGSADEKRARVAKYDADKAAEAETQGTTGGTPSDVASGANRNPANTNDAGHADLAPPDPSAEGEAGFKGDAAGFSVQTDQGPGTANPQVATEATARPIASTADVSSSGPLEPPRDALIQSDPPLGYHESTTDHVYSEAGGLTFPGEKYDGLVDDDDNAIDVGDLFTDNDPGKTWVTVEKRIYEVFYYPNTTEKAKRLLYVPGQRVSRQDAARIEAALDRVANA